MDLKQGGVGVVLGAVLMGLPLFLAMESRIEKRVRNEVKIAETATRQEAAADARKVLEGRMWTVEQEIKVLRLEHAKGE